MGRYAEGVVVELRPKGEWRLVDAASGERLTPDPHGESLRDEAISQYQVASEAYRRGDLRRSAAR